MQSDRRLGGIEAIEFENFEERSSSTIEAAVAKSAISTPQLHVEKKTGKRLTEERMVEDSAVDALRETSTTLMVTTPFTGDDTALRPITVDENLGNARRDPTGAEKRSQSGFRTTSGSSRTWLPLFHRFSETLRTSSEI